MDSATRRRSIRLGLGTLLAFVGGLVFAPEVALAGCASHERPTFSLLSEVLIDRQLLDLTWTPTAIDTSGSSRRPIPCSGPTCSGRPTEPVSPTPPPIVRLGLWAILEIAATLEAPEKTGFFRDNRQARPSDRTTSIFHPPRLGSGSFLVEGWPRCIEVF